MATEPRQYRIVGLLGRGGFGSVYLADFQGGSGFSRRVAIKLLSVDKHLDDALKRLRDEARILGLLDDRAVVTVEPPTRLNGQPAVVMDYVEGTSVRRLLRTHETMPTAAALELVQEVARVLDKAWTWKGPDGRALQLIHRDIKPDNLQLTAHGELKVLDFGIAKARFDERESETTQHLYGTTGYMAPERFLAKKDSPAGDIFSLGVVLHEMLTGERAAPYDEETDTEPVDPAVALALRMVQIDPKARPSARQVEDHCGTILKQLDGPSLRRWAEGTVPPLIHVRKDDPLVGEVVIEGDGPGLDPGVQAPPADSSGTASRSRMWLIGGSTVAALLMTISVLLLALGGGVGVWYAFQEDPVVQAEVPELPLSNPADTVAAEPEPEPEPVDPGEAPDGEGAPEPPDDEQTPPVPEPETEPEPEPKPRPKPKQAPAPRPVPAPSPAPATPWGDAADADPSATHTVVIGSVPLGAAVQIDGQDVGRTPWSGPLTEGTHELVLVLGDDRSERRVTIDALQPKRYVWKGQQRWQVFP